MKKGALILALMLAAMLTMGFASANSGQNNSKPYFIEGKNFFLEKTLDVRHSFPNGFTANLNGKQVAGLQKAGFSLEEVAVWQPLKPPGSCDPWPDCKNNGGGDDGSGDTGRQGTPQDQVPWGIERVYNDANTTTPSGGSGIDVAVLDSGVNKNHPDLSRRVTQCLDFTKGPNVKNGCDDGFGHGTHVAGTIAADSGEDGLGIYGVAPEANILAYLVCKEAGCFTDDIAAAIDYAGSNGAEIVSMSLGGDSESSLVRDAIARNLHVLFVAAGGNDGPELGTIDFPGGNANVIAVAATDSNDTVANFSSRGTDTSGDDGIQRREMEAAAPGVDVESTCAGSLDGSTSDKDGVVNGYCIISGTSMATPHVSGLAAKFWATGVADADNDGTTTAGEMRAYMQARAKANDITGGIHAKTGYDAASGYGLPTVN